MSLSLQQLYITTDEQHAEIIGDFLNKMGALAIMFHDAADQPVFQLEPAKTSLWNKTQVVALFENKIDLKKVFAKLQTKISSQVIFDHRIETLFDKDWIKETQKHFHATKFGKRLWICPTWENPPKSGAIVILDPGVAFGTGTHPTTALCLKWLDAHIHNTDYLIDYGCGSGILAIGAIKLGAQHVWATDHDPQALEATQKNAVANHISSKQLTIASPEKLPDRKADILIANILAEPLMELAAKFAELVKPNGKIVLSGILREQTEKVKMAYENWFKIIDVTYHEEWSRIEGIKS